ncbi:MAG: hypothetical protein IPM81_14325 [Saprospirales bacterium]|nr:hypothetical protein [Saprospirales bacterium]
MAKTLTIGTNYVFPVGSGEVKNDKFYLKKIEGTAFAISKDMFMTAGHVLEGISAGQDPNYFIGTYNDSESWRAWEFNRFEIHPGCDVGIFHAEVPEAKTAGWCSEEPYINGDVYSIGFPFAYDLTNTYIYLDILRGM